MANEYTTDELVSFLQHASERGMVPAATAQALMVATRNVFAVLDEAEKSDVRVINLDDTIKRFTNKRAKEFNPSSLKEYARRVRRAVELFLAWREDPASFSVKTRATGPTKAKGKEQPRTDSGTAVDALDRPDEPVRQLTSAGSTNGGYQTSFPVRAGQVVTISNVPDNLSAAEAERLAAFVRMLAVH